MRLQILDGFRGHLLLGMMIWHVSTANAYSQSLRYIHHHTFLGVFDGEFFVPIAGFVIGYMIKFKWDFDIERLRKFLKLRVFKIYKYQLICAFLVTVPFLLQAMSSHDGTDFFDSVLSVLLVNDGLPHTGILILYIELFVMFFGLSYFLLNGKIVLFYFTTFLIYVFGCSVDVNSSIHNAFGVMGQSYFNPATWYLMFAMAIIIGINIDKILKNITELNKYRRSVYMLLSALVFVVATILHLKVGYLDFLPKLIHNSYNVVDGGTKPSRTALHPLYVIRILSLSFVIALIMTSNIKQGIFSYPGRFLHWYFNLEILRKIGSQSLVMYTAHVFLVAGFFYFAKILEGFSYANFTIPISAIMVFLLFILYAYRDVFELRFRALIHENGRKREES